MDANRTTAAEQLGVMGASSNRSDQITPENSELIVRFTEDDMDLEVGVTDLEREFPLEGTEPSRNINTNSTVEIEQRASSAARSLSSNLATKTQ